jgi:hypothetical protein
MNERTTQVELLPRAAGAAPRAQVPAASTFSVKTLDLELGGGRVLRLCLSLDADGGPEDLAIVATFGPPTMRDLAEGATVPASCLPALADALAELGR